MQFDPFDSPWKPASPPQRKTIVGENSQSEARPAPGSDLESIADLRGAVDAHERAILLHSLGKHRWNQRQTAKALGLSYDQLRHCIRKHSLADTD